MAAGGVAAEEGGDGEHAEAGDEDAVEALAAFAAGYAFLDFLEQVYLALLFVFDDFHRGMSVLMCCLML